MSKSRQLCDAAIEGKADRVRSLLAEGADPNAVLRSPGWTALSCAVMGRSLEAVRALLDAGADPNRRDRTRDDDPGALFDSVPLDYLTHWAAVRVRSFSLAGLSLNVKDPSADDPLPESPADAARLLVSAGADPNAPDRFGRTLLMRYACSRAAAACVEALVRMGADPNATDLFGVSALAYAAEQRNGEVESFLRNLAAVEAGRANFDLVRAARAGDVARVDAALAAGAKVDFWSPADHTALYWAAAGRHSSVVRKLLQAGADPAGGSPKSASALSAAVSSGDAESVRLLLEQGARPLPRDEREFTLLQLAADRKDAAIVSLLGGDPARIGREFARGLASADVTEAALLVRSESSTVARAFAEMRRLKVRENVRGKTVTVTEPCFVAFQFAGHQWTTIETICASSAASELTAADAATLAERLNASAIFIAVSDTAGSAGYAAFDGATKVEERAERAGGDAFHAADQFLRRHDAYLPGWSENSRRATAGTRLSINAFPRAECPNWHLLFQ